MKKITLIIALLIAASTATAQDCQKQGKVRSHVLESVSDLSPMQKKKLERIATESKARKKVLQKEQDKVRDSIRLYMGKKEDNSEVVYRLFHREAQLQEEISREMYRTKVLSDQVLTETQFKEFQAKAAEYRAKKKQNKCSNSQQ